VGANRLPKETDASSDDGGGAVEVGGSAAEGGLLEGVRRWRCAGVGRART
jgi:hypothetical protein